MVALRISVFASPQLQAVIAGMRTLPRTVAKDIRGQTKRVVSEVWKEEVGMAHATTLQNASLVKTATVAVRDNNVLLQSGGKGKLRLSVPPKAVEFGADREVVVSYTSTSPKGTRYRETRHTQRQLPGHTPKGAIIYPAASRAIPRIAALWVQTTLRAFYQLLEAGLFH